MHAKPGNGLNHGKLLGKNLVTNSFGFFGVETYRDSEKGTHLLNLDDHGLFLLTAVFFGSWKKSLDDDVVYGGFLKWWYPTTMGVFLLKMIILGCFGGTTI